ncbi:MAG TPA: DegT/DnrJ/EryC1/StrS family aminotransferase [Candidatus Acidoferrales bacterium]|nr:DegT/DnrJ/EryC1/StrS family aminotransferase [Candidatus Acidoferrales bacterium]
MSTIGQAAPAIRISEPRFGGDVEALVLEVLRSGHIAQGPMVERFEHLCAQMAGSEYAVAVANGTVALEAALEVGGVGPGDEVITSPFTFAATLNVILRRGAVARFADIRGDFTLDPAAVAALIGPRTAAIIPVHLYGLMADMRAIETLAAAHSTLIVEDAAQAHGAAQEGRRAGSYGLGAFSFYATKNVTSGEGGCVTTSDAGIAATLRVLRNQGMRERYEYVSAGENWRMTDLAAAVAIPQLERLDAIISARRANARRLTELLGVDPRVRVPVLPGDREHVWHQYTILLPHGVDREAVIASMARGGVQAGVYYPRLVWDYDAYRSLPNVVVEDTPVAADAAARCLSLPVHPNLSDADIRRVAATLLESVEAAA